MRSFVSKVVLYAFVSAIGLLAQQDQTVEWKSALQDLEHRLSALPAAGADSVMVWRTDAESLRASIAEFAAADRNYYYTAGYPEEGRHWFFNLRYRF